MARAGEAGRITVATRMAGRGTDIQLGPGVAEAGGLAVIATEPAKALGLGFALACAIPLGCLLSIMLILPLPLGILGGILYAMLLYGAKLIASQALGDALLQQLKPGKVGSPYISMAVGLAVLTIAISVPYIGALIWIAATAAGFGGLFLAARKARLASA